MVGNAVLWALSQSIKVIGVAAAWFLFKAIVGDGTNIVKDIIEACKMGIQAGCLLLKRKFFEIIRKEKRPIVETGTDSVKAEGSVT